jgi:hypothetical protein
MFGSQDKINKILGPSPNYRGQVSGFSRSNFNINPNKVLMDIQRLLDNVPEIKSAKGNLTVQFQDGKTTTLKLDYKETGGFKL